MKCLGLAICVLVLGGAMASSASAAFPGRDGLLAVEPSTGPGLVLVNSRGGQERRICTDRSRCGSPKRPRWSSDGRVIAFGSPTAELIYSDGSCLNCQIGRGGSPSFSSDPALVTFVAGGKLAEAGIDGIGKGTIAGGGVSDAAWSAGGLLAIVRSGHVWVGRRNRLRLIAAGSAPSWSPDGSQIAIQRRGWVLVVHVRDHSIRRLVRGLAPSWSPDGKSIAFIGTAHHVLVISASGGHARQVGRVRGVAVDWQPVPKHAAASCETPPGSKAIASSPGAVVTGDSNEISSAYMGCLRADGRERLLESFGPATENSQAGLSTAAVAGDYGALVNYTFDEHYGGSDFTVEVFDLRTAAQASRLGGETVSCPDYGGYSCNSKIDQVVMNSNGFSAAHTIVADGLDTCPPSSRDCTTEQIVASDSTGVHTLDTITQPGYEPPSHLTGLGFSGDLLTWDHAGMLQSAQLR